MAANEPNGRIRVKPAAGRAVCVPERKFALLPDEGMEVQRNAYWQRRIDAGDVVVDGKGKQVKSSKEAGEK